MMGSNIAWLRGTRGRLASVTSRPVLRMMPGEPMSIERCVGGSRWWDAGGVLERYVRVSKAMWGVSALTFYHITAA